MTERRAAYRVDANQPAIVQALRAIGATVQHLHTVGDGCPDILVGYRGTNFLMEIKRSPRARMTPDERAWHEAWRGNVFVVTSPEQAIEIVTTRPEEMQI